MHRHFKLYKPFDFLSQFVKQKKKSRQRLLGELYDFPEGVMCIGRLDQHSEGLMLVTTDGKMSEYIRQKTIEKEYFVQVDGIITEEALEKIRQGVTISIRGEIYHTRPCKARKIEDPGFQPCPRKIRDDRHGPTSWASITVTEGKYRQVRKMTAVVGFPTLRLVRWRVHQFCLDDMEFGDVIELPKLNP